MWPMGTLLVFLCHTFVALTTADQWTAMRIPTEHIPYLFKNNPHLRDTCKADGHCPYQKLLNVKKCWGYEKSCPKSQRMSSPTCPGKAEGWVRKKSEQVDMFWTQGDFGYVRERLQEMKFMCEPQAPDDSSLYCCKYLRYCRATNIYLDFTTLNAEQSQDRYKEDVLKEGQVGGHCKLHKSVLAAENEHKSPLQSWFAEMEHYTQLDFKPLTSGKCDVILDRPTIFIKLDAGVNMYHHFCDYLNLYASQHMNNSFSTDINIVMWDTSGFMYGDFFHDTWKAFTDHPIIPLKDFDGKKVCVKDAVFPLLARMRMGMFYNMPLIPGCTGSSLFRAFSQHTLYRLGITQEGPLRHKIRITLLSRSTKYRKIINQDELVSAMKTVGEYQVTVVDYSHKMPFLDQLQVTHNSDIFIGMHGAGLTHTLFQPDWGVLFELYNCDDANCYWDLARLRGVHYITWEKQEKLFQKDEGHHPTLGAHKKFTDYAFDADEFMRLVAMAADHVRNHPRFMAERADKYAQVPKEDL